MSVSHMEITGALAHELGAGYIVRHLQEDQDEMVEVTAGGVGRVEVHVALDSKTYRLMFACHHWQSDNSEAPIEVYARSLHEVVGVVKHALDS